VEEEFLTLANRKYIYYSMQFNVKTSSQHENATQSKEVAKIIFQAISDEKPEFRYAVGSCAVSLLEARSYQKEK
jgi:hypothetical protein